MPKLQLKPLSDRLNDYQQGKRQLKIAARRTVAEQMGMGLYRVAGGVLAMQKRQTLQYRLLWAAILLLFVLLGYHVHIAGR